MQTFCTRRRNGFLSVRPTQDRSETYCTLLNATTFVIVLFALLKYGIAADDPSRIAAHDEYVYMIRFSPDGRSMATAAGDNTATIWDWPARRKRHVLPHDAAVYAAVFSPDEREVATGSGDGFVSLWNTADGKLIRREKQHADAVYCLDYSPDGTQLASIGGHGRKGDTTCRIWRTTDLTITSRHDGHTRPAHGVRFANNGADVITSAGDKTIRITNLVTANSRELTGHTSDVYRCAISPDGSFVASTSQDRSVRLWDFESGKVIATFKESNDPTYGVAFSNDGKKLAVVGDDGLLRILATTDFRLVRSSRLASEGLYTVAWTPDQKQLVAAGVDGRLYFTD